MGKSSRVEGLLRRVSIKATGNPEPTVDLGAGLTKSQYDRRNMLSLKYLLVIFKF